MREERLDGQNACRANREAVFRFLAHTCKLGMVECTSTPRDAEGETEAGPAAPASPLDIVRIRVLLSKPGRAEARLFPGGSGYCGKEDRPPHRGGLWGSTKLPYAILPSTHCQGWNNKYNTLGCALVPEILEVKTKVKKTIVF